MTILLPKRARVRNFSEPKTQTESLRWALARGATAESRQEETDTSVNTTLVTLEPNQVSFDRMPAGHSFVAFHLLVAWSLSVMVVGFARSAPLYGLLLCCHWNGAQRQPRTAADCPWWVRSGGRGTASARVTGLSSSEVDKRHGKL